MKQSDHHAISKTTVLPVDPPYGWLDYADFPSMSAEAASTHPDTQLEVPMANVMIFGGCVTRDAYELVRADHNLSVYIARQSLISGMSPSVPLPKNVPPLKSAFQQRQLTGDYASTLRRTLLGNENLPIDLLLMDILVDRFGVYPVEPSSFITHSVEFGRDPAWREATSGIGSLIRFGSPKHYSLWTSAASRFHAALTQRQLIDRTLVYELPWATTDYQGNPVPQFGHLSADEANEKFAPYYNYLRDLGFDVRALPSRYVASDPQHKWGPSPYHYDKPAYRWMAQQLSEKLMSTRGAKGSGAG